MDRVDVVLDPLRSFLFQVGNFLPRLGLALLVLLAAFAIAKAVRFALEKTLRAVNFHVVTQRSGMDGFLQKAGAGLDTVDLFCVVAYWAVILAGFIVASNSLGLAAVTDLLSRLMVFVPRVVVGLLILAFGSYFARFAGQAVADHYALSARREGPALARLTRFALLVFVAMIALDQLDIGVALISHVFLILLGGVVLALALAFGLGGRHWARERLEEWWPSSRAAPPPRGPSDR